MELNPPTNGSETNGNPERDPIDQLVETREIVP
jgi:hypothetical protein